MHAFKTAADMGGAHPGEILRQFLEAWQDVTDNASYTDNADAKELTTLQHAESTRVPFGSVLRTHTSLLA